VREIRVLQTNNLFLVRAMSKQSETQTGRTKNRAHAAYDHRSKAAKQRSEYAARLARARAERQRLAEYRQSDAAAQLVALARLERAKRIAAGKQVAPTIAEWRERIAVTHPALGDLAP
jgi:hypothetical protein